MIICGLDCGYIKGKAKHAQGSYYREEESTIPKNAYKVQGNGEYEVYADALFSLSSAMMTKAINVFKPKLVMNLGSGAYIRCTHAVSIDDFTLRDIDKHKYIAELKGYMCADRNAVFKHKGFYEDEVNAYKEAILGALRQGVEGRNGIVSNKRELFTRIDSIHALCLKQSARLPFVGILFEGSISHILHTMMVCALHIPNDDIALFYARCVELAESALNKMVMSYKMLRIGAR